MTQVPEVVPTNADEQTWTGEGVPIQSASMPCLRPISRIPQQTVFVFSNKMQACWIPTEIWEIWYPLRPATLVGVETDAPNTYPQQNTLVTEETAQHIPPLQDKAETSKTKVLVRFADSDVNPIPNSPFLFDPQQKTVRFVDKRQPCDRPRDDEMVDSFNKYGWLTFPLYEPSATEPQHHSRVSESKTQEWANPAKMPTGELEEIDNATGMEEFVSRRPQQ